MTVATPQRAFNEAQRLEAVRRYDILDTPPDGAFDRVCALAARFFEVPIATVTIVDEDRIWFKACQGLDSTEIPREAGLCDSAILQDDAYVVEDGLSDPRTAANSLVQGALGVRFYAAAPITTDDGYRLGTVNVIDTRPREITEADTQTLRELAAVVMDELELRLVAMREVQRERERSVQALREKHDAEVLARTLQRTLSPSKLPQIEGLDLAAHYEPFAPEQVGGDFYDVFPLAGNRSCFFLGDVCGKGPDAAALTSLARYTLRTAAMLQEGPTDILGDLNEALLLERPHGLPMCSVVYGQIDHTRPGAELSMAVGGHPFPLIIRASGEVEVVGVRGTILGAVSEPSFQGFRASLEPGDAIVLYSDGILDLSLDGTSLDEVGLAQALAAGGNLTNASEAIQRLRDVVLRRVDRPLRDDVAILVIRVEVLRDPAVPLSMR
jgi:phosphoserine phosphatase RsbU/P